MILLNKKFDLTVFLTSTTGTSRTNVPFLYSFDLENLLKMPKRNVGKRA